MVDQKKEQNSFCFGMYEEIQCSFTCRLILLMGAATDPFLLFECRWYIYCLFPIALISYFTAQWIAFEELLSNLDMKLEGELRKEQGPREAEIYKLHSAASKRQQNCL